jgi:hypothetical protein
MIGISVVGETGHLVERDIPFAEILEIDVFIALGRFDPLCIPSQPEDPCKGGDGCDPSHREESRCRNRQDTLGRNHRAAPIITDTT